MPATATGTPIRPSSNIVKPSKPASSTMPWTTRLVDVPMSVHIPPRIVTYDRGIRNFVAGSLARSAHRLIIGAKITTTGVLLRKAETKAMTGIMRSCTRFTVDCPLGSRHASSCSSRPERRTPSLTRKSRATVTMPLLLKPSSRSLGVRMPVHMNSTAPENRMRPGRILSSTRATMMTARTRMTNREAALMTAGRWRRGGR